MLIVVVFEHTVNCWLENSFLDRVLTSACNDFEDMISAISTVWIDFAVLETGTCHLDAHL